ncbi:MAG TPA: hypothetical protein VNA20_01790 [Frankiaceae bacterium]|nr:hypothetical protein [Frankiaceae bacterium]
MRVRTLLAVVAVAAALPAAPASAGVAPQVAVRSCEVEATNGNAECIVALEPNPNGFFGQSTWSGYGSADLTCFVSGRSFHLEGGYGSDWIEWPHDADVCRLSVRASYGTSSAYVE